MELISGTLNTPFHLVDLHERSQSFDGKFKQYLFTVGFEVKFEREFTNDDLWCNNVRLKFACIEY